MSQALDKQAWWSCGFCGIVMPADNLPHAERLSKEHVGCTGGDSLKVRLARMSRMYHMWIRELGL